MYRIMINELEYIICADNEEEAIFKALEEARLYISIEKI